jgi:hypothetical protein
MVSDGSLVQRGRRWAVGGAAVLAAVGSLLAAVGVDTGRYESTVSAGLVLGVVTVAFSTGALVWAFRYTPDGGSGVRTDRSDRQEPTAQGAVFEQLGEWRVLPPVPASDRDRLRSRLRVAAVEVVATSAVCDRESAREQVRRGDWTDDAAAASFLGDCPPPRRVAWAARVSSAVAFAVGARATVVEIDCRADGKHG